MEQAEGLNMLASPHIKIKRYRQTRGLQRGSVASRGFRGSTAGGPPIIV